MSKPAARVGDMHTCPMVTPGMPPVPHVGGPIMPPGNPTVLIAGMPAARQGDMCTCVGPPDSIAMGSPTVLIGGIPAARVGDPTVHGGVITVGCPTVLIGDAATGAPAPSAFTALVREGLENARDGKLEGSVVKMDNLAAGSLGGVTHKMDLLHAAGEVQGKAGWTGGSASASAEMQIARQSVGAFVGGDANNPFAEATASWEVFSAEAKGDFLLGSDGERSGFIARGSAGARVVVGEVSGEGNIPIPFTDWSISLRAKKSSDDFGGRSGSAGAHAYVDHRTKRFHVGAAGLVAKALRVPFDFDISIGRKYQSRERPSY